MGSAVSSKARSSGKGCGGVAPWRMQLQHTRASSAITPWCVLAAPIETPGTDDALHEAGRTPATRPRSSRRGASESPSSTNPSRAIDRSPQSAGRGASRAGLAPLRAADPTTPARRGLLRPSSEEAAAAVRFGSAPVGRETPRDSAPDAPDSGLRTTFPAGSCGPTFPYRRRQESPANNRVEYEAWPESLQVAS